MPGHVSVLHEDKMEKLMLEKLGGEKATFVERVLDVRQGQLCWIIGTVYMEMALKPNVLDDISKEVQENPTKIFRTVC